MRGAVVGIVGLLAACSPEGEPQTDSQTNWLRGCESNAECGSLTCHCGVCTRTCEQDETCAGLAEASCVAKDDAGSIALCDGQAPDDAGLCLRECTEDSCAEGQMCLAGSCSPVPEPAAVVVVDPQVRHQVLTGLGATLAYGEDEVVRSPRRGALYDAMFADVGLEVLRLRNRYGHSGEDDLASASALVEAARDRLGHLPTLILTSWSPPAALKASGELECQGNVDTCTLASAPDGGFDYAAYGEYWRATVEAYADAGVVPDYIGIQNNPDFVPSAAAPGEGCKFLPSEGTATVPVGGEEVEVTYPGFDQALEAVAESLAGLSESPRLIAPEVSAPEAVPKYLAALDLSRISAISHHMYGTDPTAVSESALNAVRKLGGEEDLPVLQTEIQADGLGTAILIHYALAVEGASAYVQSVLAGPESSIAADLGTMISIGAEGFRLEDPYHALRHFAFFTKPGWFRVDAAAKHDGELLTSAWAAPDGETLAVMIVNPGSETIAAQVEVSGRARASSTVTRTVFDGDERSAALGSLPEAGIVRVPGHAIVTVTFGT